MDAVEDLRAACPELTVHTEGAELDAASVDALRPFRGRPEFATIRTRPLALVLPGDTAQVAAVVRWANRSGVPLVVRGGGSGLMGGAASIAPSVMISLSRLAGVGVDPDACLVRAGAGATLRRVDEALTPHGLMLGHDPWTVAVATVGGALSTNGLGYLGARAGSMGAQVRAVEAVLGGGEVLRTRASPARSTGFDLTRLLVGSEGTFGIVTEATLAVLPLPEERVLAGHRLPSFEAGVRVAVELRRRGVRPASLELTADDEAGSPLLLVFDGLRGEARLHAERAAAIARDAGGDALPAAQADEWWSRRHAIAERWAESAGFRDGDWLRSTDRSQFDYAHVGVPVEAITELSAEAHRLAARHDVRLVEEGLWQWPELYSVVVAGGPASAAGVRAAIDGVCRAAQDAGGTMEYCHGVGWQLAHLMERELGAVGLDLLRRLKRTLDPRGILNPGKVGDSVP
jgi:FAD/FMN-containing dehydrogenase